MSQAEKKKTVAKKPADHPKYIDMITAAIVALTERSGSSRQAIVKYITANYKVGEKANVHVKLALRKAVTAGSLVQTKGSGASGSFKVKKVEKPKPKAKPAVKKPAAKKVKKPAAKKPAASKKTTAKKSTPTKKSAAAKKSTPKKKPAAKKPASAKKPKAKKTPAKKPVKKAPKKKTAKK